MKIVREPMVCLQVIPDRTVDKRNYQAQIVPKALSEFYSRKLDRVNIRKLEYTEQVRIAFRILLSPDKIAFYYFVPGRLRDFLKQKILAVWNQATVRPATFPVFDATKIKVAELTYRRHDIFSLVTDRDTNAPMPSLFATTTDMLPGDMAMIDIVMEPYSRIEWEYSADKAYERFRKGFMPKKFELSKGNIVGLIPAGINAAMTAVQGELIELTGGNKKSVTKPFDMEAKLLLINGLTEATKQKPHGAVVKTHIRIISQSDNKERAAITLHALTGAYKDISGDNELVRRDIHKLNPKTIINLMERAEIPARGGILLSCAEIGKLIQLPTAGLQEEYKQIEAIGQKEVNLSNELFEDGIPFAHVTKGGITREAKIQTKDHNILCLPHISLGAMGTGKTTQDAVVALGFLHSGFSAVAIDVADGGLINQIRDALPTEFPSDHIIDLDFGNLEYPIPLNWSEITRKIYNNKGTADISARKAANRLTAQLIHFVKTLSDEEMKPRMESYLSAAGKAVLRRPENSLLEVVLALTSESYRGLLLKDKLDLQATETLQALQDASEGQQQQVVGPIMNRLNILLSNEAMGNCILQRGNPKIDFRKWLDGDEKGPYFIGLRVPKDELLDIATDRIVTFLIAKVWLSVLSRYDVSENKRRPAVMVMDEPHQFMSSSMLWSDMVREARKWRLKLYWSAHNFRDFAKLTKTIKDAGCQYSVFRSSKETYQDLLEELYPFTLEDLTRIPDRYYAVNKIVLPHTPNTPAFLGRMEPPPKLVKNRDYRRSDCSKLYGKYIDDVEMDIYKRRKAHEGL